MSPRIFKRKIKATRLLLIIGFTLLLLLLAFTIFLACIFNAECDTSYYKPITLPHDTTTAAPVKVPEMDWSRATLNGPVQKVQQFRYAAKMKKRSKQITKGKLLETVTEQYNKQGNLLEKCTRDTTRFHGESFTEYYDEQGNRVEDQRSWCKDYLPYLRRYIQVFDQNNDLIYNVILDEHGDTLCAFHRTYQYDEVGNLISATVYDAEDTVVTSHEYFFMGDSIVIRDYRDGILTGRTVLDSNMRHTTIYFHLSGTDFLEKLTAGIMTYRYDADGRLTDETREDSYGKEVTRYDKHGNVVESLYYKHKKKGESDRYLGLMLESRRTRSYEYDEYGNWIRAVETIENAEDLKHKRVQHNIYERVITYY
ncbi:MAG: hypothetical protein IKU03_03170 [Bacteroidales bacterium]|nr:hypothetical protein [Bacteroidales bacterium]